MRLFALGGGAAYFILGDKYSPTPTLFYLLRRMSLHGKVPLLYSRGVPRYCRSLRCREIAREYWFLVPWFLLAGYSSLLYVAIYLELNRPTTNELLPASQLDDNAQR